MENLKENQKVNKKEKKKRVRKKSAQIDSIEKLRNADSKPKQKTKIKTKDDKL